MSRRKIWSEAITVVFMLSVDVRDNSMIMSALTPTVPRTVAMVDQSQCNFYRATISP